MENVTLFTIPRQQIRRLMELARQGDTRAAERFCLLAAPLLDQYSSARYFAAVLGKDEARSIAALSVIDFLMYEPLKDEPQDFPRMLRQVIKCDLLNQARNTERRLRFETHSLSGPDRSGNGDRDTEETEAAALLPAGRDCEPEQQAFRKELRRKIGECFHYLGAKEKVVIAGLFFRQLSVAELARELQCSAASVSAARYSALKKLRVLFEAKHITP